MLIRLASPGKPLKVIDLGPAHAQRHAWWRERMTIEQQLTAAAELLRNARRLA